MKRLAVAAALTLSAPFVWAQAKHHLKPGNWKVTVTSEMQGAPFTPPPMTFDRCLTPAEANDPKQLTQPKKGAGGCENADVKQSGNKVTWTIVCHQHGGTQHGTGEMTFSEDSYTGTNTIEMDNPRLGHVKMIQHLKGQRTGDCT